MFHQNSCKAEEIHTNYLMQCYQESKSYPLKIWFCIHPVNFISRFTKEIFVFHRKQHTTFRDQCHGYSSLFCFLRFMVFQQNDHSVLMIFYNIFLLCAKCRSMVMNRQKSNYFNNKISLLTLLLTLFTESLKVFGRMTLTSVEMADVKQKAQESIYKCNLQRQQITGKSKQHIPDFSKQLAFMRH